MLITENNTNFVLAPHLASVRSAAGASASARQVGLGRGR